MSSHTYFYNPVKQSLLVFISTIQSSKMFNYHFETNRNEAKAITPKAQHLIQAGIFPLPFSNQMQCEYNLIVCVNHVQHICKYLQIIYLDRKANYTTAVTLVLDFTLATCQKLGYSTPIYYYSLVDSFTSTQKSAQKMYSCYLGSIV